MLNSTADTTAAPKAAFLWALSASAHASSPAPPPVRPARRRRLTGRDLLRRAGVHRVLLLDGFRGSARRLRLRAGDHRVQDPHRRLHRGRAPVWHLGVAVVRRIHLLRDLGFTRSLHHGDTPEPRLLFRGHAQCRPTSVYSSWLRLVGTLSAPTNPHVRLLSCWTNSMESVRARIHAWFFDESAQRNKHHARACVLFLTLDSTLAVSFSRLVGGLPNLLQNPLTNTTGVLSCKDLLDMHA